MADSDYDSDDSLSQLEKIRNADVKPGMFVSGWDDPDDLIIGDANPHATLESKILWATNEGKLEIVRTILNNRASCVSATDDDGYTPLHRACYENHIDIAKLLIQYGANVNATTEFKWTPLHSASQWTNAYCVALLLQHGANVNARTDGDQTPLHIAASVSKCRSTAMTLLFHPDIDPNLLNNSNEKAAEIAKRSGRAFPIFQMAETAFQNDIGLID